MFFDSTTLLKICLNYYTYTIISIYIIYFILTFLNYKKKKNINLKYYNNLNKFNKMIEELDMNKKEKFL